MATLRREPLLLAWMVVVCAPLAGFAAYLLAHQWFPQGDEALVALRAHDVLSTHPPLLGMRSTSNLTNPGVWAHHPGPLEYYALASPYAISVWSPSGIIVGCALIATVFVVVAIYSGFRAGAWPGAIVAGVVALGLERVYGPLLVQPLNTWPPILGLLALMMLAWRLLRGHTQVLAAYVLVASFVAQCHLSFLPVVGFLSLVLGGIGVVRWHRERGSVWPVPGFHRPANSPWWQSG